MKINTIYNEDCLDTMARMPEGFVDLVLTSPPYDNQRSYESKIDLSLIGKEISRVLVFGGVSVLVIQDQTVNWRKTLTSFRTIIDWCDNTEMGLFECCIYKRSGVPGAWWNKRFRVDHEYIAIFVKGRKPNYFSKEHMKIPDIQAGFKKKGKERKQDGTFTEYKFNESRHPKLKCPGTILDYESARASDKSNKLKVQHPAWFPDKLANDFILCFTEESNMVYDPFTGSGTTVRMAQLNNRKYIGSEISFEYCELAKTMLKYG